MFFVEINNKLTTVSLFLQDYLTAKAQSFCAKDAKKYIQNLLKLL